MKRLLAFICVVGIIGLSGCHSYEAKTTIEPAAIPDTPASLPISASVNLNPHSEAEEFHSPKYQAATGGCIHASAAILLSENQTVSLTLESDCAIDWHRDWENPGPRVAVLFPQMISYTEDGWFSIRSSAIETKHIISFNEGRRLEVLITVHPDNSGASIPNIYKLLAINLDPNKSHSLKYSVSPYSGEPFPKAFLTAPELVTPHNGATNIELTPTLLWAEMPNAKGYELWLSRDYEFSDIIHSVSLGGTAYQVRDGLNPSTRYYWMVVAKLNPADPNTPVAYSAIWTFTTVPASSPPPEPTIDDVFLSRWGHTYYNNAPRVSFSSFDIDKLIIQVSLQIPWQLCYQPGVFDCSEMTAYLEYMLERHGYTTEIAAGTVMGLAGHAWVLVHNNVADCWMPIEATSPTGTLDAILFHLVTGGMVLDYLEPQYQFASIHTMPSTWLSEFDWWDSPYADQLVAASDRARVSKLELPPLPEIKYPDLPPLPMPKPSLLPNVTIESVGLPAEVEVGKVYDYLIALRNNESRSVTVTLKIHSSVTGDISSKSVTVPANVTKHVTDQIKFQPAGVRTMTYTILYNGQHLDSLSKTVEAK